MSSSSAAPARAAGPGGPSRRLIVLLSLTCGVAVGNLYFPQAVAPLVADGLGVPPGSAALVATAAQSGYAAGNLLLVPLGDRVPHRVLIAAMLAATGLGLLGAAGAAGLPALLGASALVGVTTVVAQVIAPMAAGLVPDDRRGAVLGALMSGSIGGILLARTFGGLVGEWLGWRAPYLVAAAVSLCLATALAFALPATVPPSRQRYLALLAEPLRLLRREPDLRRTCLYQAAVFGGFQAVWTGLALLLTGPVYGFGAQAVGLLALVSAVTMLWTPLAGRQVDRSGSCRETDRPPLPEGAGGRPPTGNRRGPERVSLAAMLGALASAGVLVPGGSGGAVGIAALAAGTLLLDVAMQSGTVANQARIFALRPDARSRVNTAYMTCSFLGGSTGSWLGAAAYGRFGWTGVCALLAVLAAAALARHLVHRAGGPPESRKGAVERHVCNAEAKTRPGS